MLRSGVRALLCVALCLVACGGESPPSADPTIGRCTVLEPTPGVTAEIGTGNVDFEPLTAGQSVQIETGVQGGYHVIAHARITGMAPGDAAEPGSSSNPETTFCAFRMADGAAIHLQPTTPLFLGYEPDGAAFTLPSGRILQLSNEVAPSLGGETIVLSVAVRSPDGQQAYGEQTLTAAAPN